MTLNGVTFDGCRESDGTMLEAKGPGYAWALSADGVFRPYYTGRVDLDDQMDRMVVASGGRAI